jgi:phenylpyruvate tautomerase PptA (4-oxalocrotonate tautomerase family)
MPLYTVLTQDGRVADDVKATIAEEITRIHTTVINVPRTTIRSSITSSS